MTECKWSVYYASSQGIKGSSRNIKRMDGCQQLHFSPQRWLRWGGGVVSRSFTLHLQAACIQPQITVHSLVFTACLFPRTPSKHFKPLTSPPAGTLVHNRTFSVEFFGSTLRLLTQTGTSTAFPLFIIFCWAIQ